VSVGAFEHFGFDRYNAFFDRAYELLPSDGIMLLHTIVQAGADELGVRNLPITMRHLKFFKFIMDEIFPGGRLPSVALIEDHATRAGFAVNRVHPLRLHYARTLDHWATALQANEEEAVAIQSREAYDRYMKYLTGCAELFRDGYTDAASSPWPRAEVVAASP
jgi:cyclopropane-fatty-acyl-phospholipid synthase